MTSSALYKRGGAGHLTERNYTSQSTILADSRAGDDYLDELVGVMMTPKGTSRLHVPEVRIINAQVLNMNRWLVVFFEFCVYLCTYLVFYVF